MTAPRALVLTAGLGTRLRPLTYARAKAAVPVNGEPLARRVIRWLASHGIVDLVLNLHHHPETIAAVVGDGSDCGARVRYSWENPVLGSAGGPRHALPLLTDGGSGLFLLVNGDTLTDVDLPALLALHADSGAEVTMALIPNPRPDHYGGVQVSEEGWVTGFTRPGRGPSYHFIGVQAARASVFANLEDGVPAESVNSLYPGLIARNPRAVRAFVSDAAFRDIGTTADYVRTSVELAAVEGDRLASGRRLQIDDGARVVSTIVWDDVVIGRGAEIVQCVLADGVRVPAGARYERCAIVRADGRAAQKNERVEGALLVAPIDA
jgi:NDP-sugar pyrophosphorylase family protein